MIITNIKPKSLTYNEIINGLKDLSYLTDKYLNREINIIGLMEIMTANLHNINDMDTIREIYNTTVVGNEDTIVTEYAFVKGLLILDLISKDVFKYFNNMIQRRSYADYGS